MSTKVFLSAVSDEFADYRELLRHDLTRPNVEVKIEEDFIRSGTVTLDLLDRYIRDCDAVVHLIGEMTGSIANPYSERAILESYRDLPERYPFLRDVLAAGGLFYTQWEAWLALYHRKPLMIATAAPDAADRGPRFNPGDASRAAQKAHLKRLNGVESWGCTFRNRDELAKKIALTTILDLLAKARGDHPPWQPRSLPYASLGSLFKGRAEFVERLGAALRQAGSGRAAAVVGMAVHGLGGIGKTRLAVEYAWRHLADHSALLCVSAETPDRLSAGLAALAGADILNLPEKEAREDAAKIRAVLAWLDRHPGWLLIFDNVDDRKAAAEVERLLARLSGGQVLITARMSNFAACVDTLPLEALSLDAATDFLLERTEKRRRKAPDDAARARLLAEELGGLALGLEQAGAYIGVQRMGFARYLALWREGRAGVRDWFDKTLVSYNHDVGLAATWRTSVAALTPPGRRLLDRLAFLAPESVPETLLDVADPGAGENFDAREALADLYAYSLATPIDAADGKPRAFAIHRLVQAFSRREMNETQHHAALESALRWMDAAFVGHPQDVRTWPLLDPLAPHALAVAEQGDKAAIAEPTGRLMAQLGVLFQGKAEYAPSERLKRRALAIAEASLPPDHSEVAIHLNNLATLLQATNRLAEAEPLMRRALAMDETSFGPDHPNVARDLNNLARLLQATNRLAEAEPLMRRALAVDETSFGPDHPNVAIRLNNLALLLQATNRLAEAEPLMRRALAMDETSLGRDHPNVARNLNNLAQLLQATNRLAEAEPLMRRALAIDEASFGPDHPNVAIRLNNLATLLKATNRLAEAEPLIRRAVTIFEASLGSEHPSTIATKRNLAFIAMVSMPVPTLRNWFGSLRRPASKRRDRSRSCLHLAYREIARLFQGKAG